MADITGKWAIDVATLAGSRRYDLTLTAAGTTLTGTAVGATGPVPIRDGTVAGDAVQFRLDFVAPVAMSVVFDLRVIGNRMSGTAQSGPFPASTVLGTRAA
ncbi:hypothetical protein SAMN04487846_0782 [Microbacterium sp. cf046]|uniref:hypothetical protein n=1 Tax=Microbacterium sp. cf046 TaxID=1761803 RepID=UPI0008E8A6F7|nr:hypothetical protein [Microbacterium sp. cf046]SFR93307.1 hypothetical protein SAMN04487846_0782 [Microbacterium sp. cf046]